MIHKWFPQSNTTNSTCQTKFLDCSKTAADNLAYFSKAIMASENGDKQPYLDDVAKCYQMEMSQCQRNLDACLNPN